MISDAKSQIANQAVVKRQLAALLDSDPFRQSERQKRFLSYVVEEELAGRGERISQFAIATDVFDRDASFDPAIDSVVRVEARRLRTKLSEYYAVASSAGEIRIELPKGRYRAHIELPAPELAVVGADGSAAPHFDRAPRPTIAVLPLDNLSGDPAQDYFSDGITEDIITDLSKVSGLAVISRHSTFVYKHRSVAAGDISEDLGARYLVEGSVRRDGNRVRITAQLIDALEDRHLWAERYDRALDDIFAVQDEVTRLIVNALNVTLTERENRRLGVRGTHSVAAHDLLLRAIEQFYQFSSAGVSGALRLLEKIAAEDPDYADARAWHARVLVYAAIAGYSQSSDCAVGSALAMAKQAAALDPQLAHARAALGWTWVWAGSSQDALGETAAALELDPSFADGHLWRGMALCSTGEGAAALQVVHQAIRLNPHYSVTYLHALGLALFALGEHDEVLLQCERSARRSPDFLPNYLLELASRGLLGQGATAGTARGAVKRLDPMGRSIVPQFFHAQDLKRDFQVGLAAAGLKAR